MTIFELFKQVWVLATAPLIMIHFIFYFISPELRESYNQVTPIRLIILLLAGLAISLLTGKK